MRFMFSDPKSFPGLIADDFVWHEKTFFGYVSENWVTPSHGRSWFSTSWPSRILNEHIWGFPEIGVPPNHPFLDGIFPNKNQPFWIPPWLWKPPYKDSWGWWTNIHFSLGGTIQRDRIMSHWDMICISYDVLSKVSWSHVEICTIKTIASPSKSINKKSSIICSMTKQR